MLLKSKPVVKMLASFLGFGQSTLPAIAVTPLHFRNLWSVMIKALKGSKGRQGYQSAVCLSPEANKRTGTVEGLFKNEQWPWKNKTLYSQMLPSNGGEHI